MKMKLSPKAFLGLAILVVLIAVVAINWEQLKKLIAGTATNPDGTKQTIAQGLTAIVTGKTSTATGSTATGAATTTTGSSSIGTLDYNKDLHTGVSGAEVTQLQQLLNQVNVSQMSFRDQLVVDGKFGSKTLIMLQMYGQVDHITLNQAFAKIKAAYGL